MKVKTMLKSISIVALTFVIVYSCIRLGPTFKISQMSDAEIIEYVSPMSDEEYVDLLESITKKQATRVFDIMLAYNIYSLSQTDAFTF